MNACTGMEQVGSLIVLIDFYMHCWVVHQSEAVYHG